MIKIDYIGVAFFGTAWFYVLCRLAAYGIFKSWFQAKHNNERKECSDGKGQKEGAFIERRKA